LEAVRFCVGTFANTRQEDLTPLVRPLLSDPDFGVRQATTNLVWKLGQKRWQ
jgi:hypothetical protein